MYIRSLGLTAICQNGQEQTACSLGIRIASIGLGSIALLAGILILSKISRLSSLGTTAGWASTASGSFFLLMGICLRCVKRDNALPNSLNTDSIDAWMTAQSFNFAQITPQNFEKYLDVGEEFSFSAKYPVGRFIFKKCLRDNQVYLKGCFICCDGGVQFHGGLEIQENQFVHYPQMNQPPVFFSNLQEFFNYLFRGGFYLDADSMTLAFFIIKTSDGKEVRYFNPYKTV